MPEQRLVRSGYPSQADGVEIQSEGVQDVLDAMPHWLVRWGISVIVVAVAVTLLGAWAIRYPTIVSARIVVTTLTPPLPVVSRASGKLTLRIDDGASVAAGRVVGWVENPSDVPDVLALERMLSRIERPLMRGAVQIAFEADTNASLGDLQGAYSTFAQSYRKYRAFYEDSYHANRIQNVRQQLEHYENLKTQLRRHRDLIARATELAEQQYAADRSLFGSGHMSESARAHSESTYLAQKQALATVEADRIRNDLQLSRQREMLLTLQHEHDDEERTHAAELQATFRRLSSDISTWKKTYLLTAPTDGRVSLFKFWSDNQFVTVHEEVMMVVPQRSSGALVGRARLPRSGAGRVREGQSVRIRFDSYPFRDFGVVEARVEAISLVARDDIYVVDVSFANGLTSTYNRVLGFKPEMQGTAAIVTEELRLFARIFNRLRPLSNAAWRL